MTPTTHVPYGLVTLTVDLAWQQSALCAEVGDVEMFHPEKGQPTRPAKRICAECPVRADCLEWALETRQESGVYGGLSARQRQRLLQLAAEEASA